MENNKRVFLLAAVFLFAAILLLGAGFSECPVGYYPDPSDSNCKQGVPYSVSITHKNLGGGRVQFDIRILNVAQTTPIGITSSSEFVVPAFHYSDGSKVQLGDYSRETTVSSIAKGGCGAYPLSPGDSVTFSTVTIFKPNQDGREITASADVINWMTLPAYPTCSPISAQGRENRAGSDKFVFKYGLGEPATCSAEGASCVGKVCCEGLYCNAAGACAKIESGASAEGGSPEGTGAQTSGSSAGSGTGSLLSNPLVLGILLGVVVVGAIAYFGFFNRGKDGGERVKHHQGHRK